MSAPTPEADMCGAIAHVCFVPKADLGSAAKLTDALFNQLIGALLKRHWYV